MCERDGFLSAHHLENHECGSDRHIFDALLFPIHKGTNELLTFAGQALIYLCKLKI